MFPCNKAMIQPREGRSYQTCGRNKGICSGRRACIVWRLRLRNAMKKPRRDGGHKPGLLRVPYGGTCDGEGKPITLLFYRLIISITNAHFLHLRFTVGPSVAILSGLTARDSRFARLRGKLVTVGKLGGKGRAFLFVLCSGGARASASVGALFLSLSVANWVHGRRPKWVKASVSLSLHSRPRHRAGPLLAVCSNDGASPRHHRGVRR